MGYPPAEELLALLVAGETDQIDVLDGLLTLKGLRLIYERNSTEGGKGL